MTERISPGTVEYRKALLALFCIGLSAFALIYTVQPILRLIGEEFGKDAGQTALLMSTSTGAIALAVIPLGQVSARIGRSRMIIISLAISVIAGIIIAFAQSWTLLLVLRTVQGIALAGPPAAALAWVAEEIAPFAINRVGGLYIAGTTVGGMVGRLLAGFASDLWGWRGGVLSVGVSSAIFAGLAHLLLPASTPGIGQGGRGSTRRGARAQLVRCYAFGGLGMLTFAGLFNIIGYRTALPPYSLSAGLGSMFFITYLAGTASSSFAGRVSARLGLRTAIAAAIVTMAVGVGITMLRPLPIIWLGLAVLCAGFFAMHALASSTASRLHPQGSARYLLSYYLGSSAGSIIYGLAWDGGGWFAAGITSFIVIAGLAVFALGIREPGSGAEAVTVGDND
ncbi:MAG: MFS transporter [Flaviflexus sp.]|nr:MFS transporter [Flaviflexus sp.]